MGVLTTCRVRCAAGLSESRALEVVREHQTILAEGGPRLVQPRHWRPVTRVEAGGREFAVKQYARGGTAARLRRLVVASKARRAWEAARRLEGCGFATAPLAACVEVAGLSGDIDSYLVTGWVDGCFPTARIEALRRDGDRAGCFRLLEGGGAFIGRMHRDGLWLEDFWDQNFLVVDDGGPAFVLVDFDSARFGGLTGPQQLRNLRQFSRCFNRDAKWSDRPRFLDAYLTALGISPRQDPALRGRLLELLAVPSHTGTLDPLCREYWERIEPLVGEGRIKGPAARQSTGNAPPPAPVPLPGRSD